MQTVYPIISIKTSCGLYNVAAYAWTHAAAWPCTHTFIHVTMLLVQFAHTS